MEAVSKSEEDSGRKVRGRVTSSRSRASMTSKGVKEGCVQGGGREGGMFSRGREGRRDLSEPRMMMTSKEFVVRYFFLLCFH